MIVFKIFKYCKYVKASQKVCSAFCTFAELSQFLQYIHNKEYSIINSITNYPDALSADHKYSINRQKTAPALKSCIPNEFPT